MQNLINQPLISPPANFSDLPFPLQQILPSNYTYQIENYIELEPILTSENITIGQIETDFYVNINTKESALKWLDEFQEISKTTMRLTRTYITKGQRVVFRELRHCIHSDIVKQKNSSRDIKNPNSQRNRDINCSATINFRLRKSYLIYTHPLEINLRFTHNHLPNSAASLSFRPVSEETQKQYINLFNMGHSAATARHIFEDQLHLSTSDDDELVQLLADRAKNPDQGFIKHLYNQFRKSQLGDQNRRDMFIRLEEMVNEYNNSGKGRAIFQTYNSSTNTPFILCIVTNLMKRVHEKIHQAGELCYFDASASFDPLNTSISLLYTSCAAGALPLGLFLTSDEAEVTIENAINLLKTILPGNAFYNRGINLGPEVFITDDSYAERNALDLCWPSSIKLLCIFHVLQAFWRWLYESKHGIHKDDRVPIIQSFKAILYASSILEMENRFLEFKSKYFIRYNQLAVHCTHMWERRNSWALSYRQNLLLRGNHTNNYVERSFGLIKDIIFARTQAYNAVQIFQFIITNMERFYERRLLAIANRQTGYLELSKRFFCPGWEIVNQQEIKHDDINNIYIVPSVTKPGQFYIVDPSIGTCTCPAALGGTPCKHQAAVVIKYQIESLDFIFALSINDCMIYRYIACGKFIY